MPRGKRIKDEDVIRLSDGRTQKEIADELGCTRQMVSIMQKRLREEGGLEPKEYAVTATKPDGQPSWEGVRSFVLTAIERAGRVSELEAELIQYKRGYDNALTELKEYEKVKDEERRYKVALHQGDINPPLVNGGGGKPLQLVPEGLDFGAHYICTGKLKFSYDKCLPDNIISEALLFSIEYNITPSTKELSIYEA